jgi:stearoyl-CoA desaturase (delta-9 desaturase)
MPPAKVLRNEHRLGARVITRAATQLASHFNPARIASAITSAVHGPELIALRESLLRRRQRATGDLKDLHLPPIPNREQILAEAKNRFASSVSLEEIADRAYAIVLDSISACLAGHSHLPVNDSQFGVTEGTSKGC